MLRTRCLWSTAIVLALSSGCGGPPAAPDKAADKAGSKADAKTADTKSGDAKTAAANPAVKRLPEVDAPPDPTKTEAAVNSPAKSSFGKLADGRDVELYTLANKAGTTVQLMTYGAAIVSIKTPDKAGKPGEVTLGFDTLDGYLSKNNPHFGCTTGRFANRIAKGKFTLEGKEYTLATNNGPNHLHGGLKGFDKQLWKATPLRDDEPGVKFEYTSPDGEEGYPGALTTEVTYRLSADSELRIEYKATTDKATPLNLTNHTYFNLGAPGASDILGHELTLQCDQYVPVNAELIPTGELAPVKGTPMDFTTMHTIGERIMDVGDKPKGYDHCYVINEGNVSPTPCAKVVEPKSGRVMEVFTTEPGVQLYTGNFLNGFAGRGGKYPQHSGFCLETQHFPDSINQPNFPTTVLKPGETYMQVTIFKFWVAK